MSSSPRSMLKNLAVPMILYFMIVVLITALTRSSYFQLTTDSEEQLLEGDSRLVGTAPESEGVPGSEGEPVSEGPDWETRMAQIHLDRRTALQGACEAFDLTGPPPPPKKLHKLRYNDPYRIVYCDVAKAGSTTMKEILAKVDPNYEYIRRNGLHDPAAFNDLSLFSAGSPDLKFRLTNYTKFMIVREPLERLLSAYQDKFKYGPGVREYESNYGKHFLEVRTPRDSEKWKRIATRTASREARLNVTFAEFVRGVLTGEEQFLNIHWQPQHLICHPCQISYDYIGHLETMQNDVKYIMHKTGMLEKVAPPTQSARRAGKNMANMYEEIPLQDIRKLGRLFAFDYIAYSFNFEKTVRNMAKIWENDLRLFL